MQKKFGIGLLIPKIPVFGSYPQFENPKYQYISNRPCLLLILPKNSIGDGAVYLIRILAIEIVGTNTIQFKAKADASLSHSPTLITISIVFWGI